MSAKLVDLKETHKFPYDPKTNPLGVYTLAAETKSQMGFEADQYPDSKPFISQNKVTSCSDEILSQINDLMYVEKNYFKDPVKNPH